MHNSITASEQRIVANDLAYSIMRLQRKYEPRKQTSDESKAAAMYTQLNAPGGTTINAMIAYSAFSPSIEQQLDRQSSSIHSQLSALQSQLLTVRNQLSPLHGSLFASPPLDHCFQQSCSSLIEDNFQQYSTVCNAPSLLLPTFCIDSNSIPRVATQNILEHLVKSASLRSFPFQKEELMQRESLNTQQIPLTEYGQHIDCSPRTSAFKANVKCLPRMLERFRPQILRSHVIQSNTKPIPKNDPIDLISFRIKNLQDWSMDDVMAWIFDVAKRNQVVLEDIEMHNFADCSGKSLLLMTEQNFESRDYKYGHLLFREFRKLIADKECVGDCSQNIMTTTVENVESAMEVCRPIAILANASPHGIIKTSVQKTSLMKCSGDLATCSEFDTPAFAYHLASSRITSGKRKCTKPRRRSQHTKGNKLWEFIRDSLTNPATCPSIVRWEDPNEGVFRIVESEKLAKLWGEKKNNKNMTYEKLSRAMRTYYEKRILVPVPKTGLYPKKLVYKFGPSAHGWEKVNTST